MDNNRIIMINQCTNNVIVTDSLQYIEQSGVSCSARHTPLQKIIQEVELDKANTEPSGHAQHMSGYNISLGWKLRGLLVSRGII